MALNNCVIVFDQNEHGTYFTGQVVSGKVIITLEKSKKIKGIKLQVCGYAFCQFKDKHTRHERAKGVKKHLHTGREDYIATTTYLVGSEDSRNFTLEAGTYTYHFSCPIPLNCPSSFEGSMGHIRYLAKVSFLRSGASNRTHNVGFTVLKALDLNQEIGLLKGPINNEAQENFCLSYDKAVQIRLDITQNGYAPGQVMLVCVRVDNQSSFNCKKLLIFLNLRAVYTTDTPCARTKLERICLVKKACGAVPKHSQRDYAETIRIPATPPSCELLSRVVRVSYEVCAVAVMPSFMRNPKAEVPITIGSVPLNTFLAYTESDKATTSSTVTTELVEAEIESLDSDESETEAQSEQPPPPTYEEAMFMTTDIADDDVNTVSDVARFTPRYPVYNVVDSNAEGIPPNKPAKRRRKKRRAPEVELEKAPVESPVQI